MMKGRIVDRITYEQVTRNIKNVFNTAGFAELNRSKVDDLRYVIAYKGESPRFGCIFGIREDQWLCPFSAPFGYMEPLKRDQTVENFEDALKAVESVAIEDGCVEMSMTLPPAFYDSDVINTWYAIMVNSGWKERLADISFALNINYLKDDYISKMHHNARKNYHIALKSGLKLWECKTPEDEIKAYNIIKTNRKSKGYPLRMSEEQVLDTIRIVPANMYIVSDATSDVASSLIYDVTHNIAQVIYWGDIPDCQDKKVINFLSHELLELYAGRGFSYLDIGPATEEGVPNYGLCDFKDSIGCERTAKFQMYKQLKKEVQS